MRHIVTSLALAVSLASAIVPTRTTKYWGKSLGKRQAEPSGVTGECIYTCPQFAQQLKGMCAITTSQCETVQAASGQPSTDLGCTTWSLRCNERASQFESTCLATTSDCVDCLLASSGAGSLCGYTSISCLNDPAISGGTLDLKMQCQVAKSVCDWELSLLSQVTTCGTANCASPCYILEAFPSVASYISTLCEAEMIDASACQRGSAAISAAVTAKVLPCAVAADYRVCGAVGIFSRPCIYFEDILFNAFASAAAACQMGLTPGSADYNTCASVYTYYSYLVQEFMASVGCAVN